MATKKIKLITDKGYFLGITKDNEKVYLEKPSWDCDWYWGFGYLEYYNNTGRPVLQAHKHWNYASRCSFDEIKDEFKTLNITDEQLWILCDYMCSFHTLREVADLFALGNSHQTETDLDLKDLKEADRINHIVLPKLFKAVNDLFEEAEKNN